MEMLMPGKTQLKPNTLNLFPFMNLTNLFQFKPLKTQNKTFTLLIYLLIPIYTLKYIHSTIKTILHCNHISIILYCTKTYKFVPIRTDSLTVPTSSYGYE